MWKIYLVTFYVEGKKVFKVGITSKSDVQERFQRLIDNGTIKGFKIHLSRWVSSEAIAKKKEEGIFTNIMINFSKNNFIKEGKDYFHNIWLNNKISGVTEIRKYNHEEYLHAYKLVDKSGYRYLNECS